MCVVWIRARPTPFRLWIFCLAQQPWTSDRDASSQEVKSSSSCTISWIDASYRRSVHQGAATPTENARSSSSLARERLGASSVEDEASTTGVAQALLASRGGRRDFLPLSRAFLQIRRKGGGPGPLSWFVATRRRKALDLYLLAHALASKEPYDVALSARVWAAAIGLPDTASSRVLISSSWTWLEQHHLIHTQRDGRLRRVWLMDDSGSGDPYTHDTKDKSRRLDYFKLPYSFWFDDWGRRLDLPAVAVLLIALSLPHTFALPQEHGGDWYGLSRDTIRRGIRTLRRQELLSMRVTLRVAPLSPTGAIEQRLYSLRGPFAPEHRHTRRVPPAG